MNLVFGFLDCAEWHIRCKEYRIPKRPRL
jgi:hypothetical protein